MSIRSLKSKLKKDYLSWNREADKYSCGLSLAREISHRIYPLEKAMKKTVAALRELGEPVPRLPFEAQPQEQANDN